MIMDFSSVKNNVEIYPLWGVMGIEGSVHSTELTRNLKSKILGSSCVEIILDYLNAGSSLGFYTTLANDCFSI